MSHWTIESRTRAADAVLTAAPVVPVIQIERPEQAVPLARCLVDAGLCVLEITLRSDVALEAMQAIAGSVPDAIVGAGTVLGAEDLAAVERAGAKFAISPGVTEALYDAADEARIPLIPAVATGGELMRGRERGYRRFKFFPAEAAGGIAMLKSWSGPFRDVRFCPTGGIDADKAPGYLALPNVVTVGGSWMLPAAALAAGDWDSIARLASAAARLGR
ncbi:MAG: bifunctional 4-hydroxy-2-oxoglutarate aldolase/2-dehydro-3-deoxy-phosphogluconate aldolase [Xanthomonadales bacterium]|nr:bifunctional 4-hydroxy-2-oxoglutarate aldolase/2-dehydro-3-deoxy-phosphogluconate aldolase [Xanthomonadales bacterium]